MSEKKGQFKLAEMYWSGHGACINTAKALEWAEKAAERGQTEAVKLRNLIFQEMTAGRVRLTPCN